MGDDCRALSGMCQKCNAAGQFEGFFAGGFKCKFCSGSGETKSGCYAHDPALGPACIGTSAAVAMAYVGSGLTEDADCE